MHESMYKMIPSIANSEPMTKVKYDGDSIVIPKHCCK